MHQLLREGVPKAEVARRLGLSRQTIYNWVKEGVEKTKEAVRASKLDPYKRYIDSRLQEFDLPATVLLKEICAQGYDGGRAGRTRSTVSRRICTVPGGAPRGLET